MVGCFFPHHKLLLVEKSSLKYKFFFNDYSGRRIANPFKCYCFSFFVEVSHGLQLRVTKSSEKCLIFKNKSWIEHWGWDNKLDYITRDAAVNVCYLCIKVGNNRLYSKLLNWQRRWFPLCWSVYLGLLFHAQFLNCIWLSQLLYTNRHHSPWWNLDDQVYSWE